MPFVVLQPLQKLSDRYLAEARRYYYVTPTSYLELLLSYKSLLAKRQSEVMTVKRRYEVRPRGGGEGEGRRGLEWRPWRCAGGFAGV